MQIPFAGVSTIFGLIRSILVNIPRSMECGVNFFSIKFSKLKGIREMDRRDQRSVKYPNKASRTCSILSIVAARSGMSSSVIVERENRTSLGCDRLHGQPSDDRKASSKTMRKRRRCGSPRPILRFSFLSTFILLRRGARMLLSPLLLCCGDAFAGACLP